MGATEGIDQTWRDHIRQDTSAHYALSMAVAIWHAEGATLALPWIRSARALPVRRALSAYVLRRILTDAGQPEEAARIHAEALREDPLYEFPALCGLAEIYSGTAQVPKDEVRRVFDQAIGMAGQASGRAFILAVERMSFLGEPCDIEDPLARLRILAAEGGPVPDGLRHDVTDALRTLCRAAIQVGAVAAGCEIVHHYARLITAGAASAQFLAWVSDRLLPAADPAEAKRALAHAMTEVADKVDTASPSAAPFLGGVAQNAFAAGFRDLGIAAARQALAADPGLAAYWMMLAKEHWLHGAEDEAIAILKDGITRNPSADLEAYLATILIPAGRLEEAEDHVARALARAPDHPLPVSASALVLVARGKAEEAVARLTATAAARLPGTEPNLALALHALGRHEQAAACVQAMPLQLRQQPFMQAIEGCVLLAMGCDSRAEACFAAAVRQGSPADLLFHARLRPSIRDTMLAGLRKAGLSSP